MHRVEECQTPEEEFPTHRKTRWLHLGADHGLIVIINLKVRHVLLR